MVAGSRYTADPAARDADGPALVLFDEGDGDEGVAAALVERLALLVDLAGVLFPIMARGLFANPLTASLAAIALAKAPGGSAAFMKRATGSVIDARGAALYARLLASSGHVGGGLALMANWQLEPLERALPGIDVPVLLIHGDRDATIPIKVSRTVATRLPTARVHAMPGLGHLAHEEQPAAVTRLILDFAAEYGILSATTAELA